jgi:outer membrane lipoprotein
MKSKLLYLTIPLLLLAGCAKVPLPEDVLSRVDPTVELADVKANPEKYQGSTLLLGGQILENKGSQEGTILEILQYRLDNSGRPVAVDEAGGRFLVRAGRFLDPEVYGKGDYLTLVGTVAGQETRQLQGVNYTYPVFTLVDGYRWRENPTFYGYPGYYYPYYGPSYYYDSPYYDPFWNSYRSPWYYDRWGYRPWRW